MHLHTGEAHLLLTIILSLVPSFQFQVFECSIHTHLSFEPPILRKSKCIGSISWLKIWQDVKEWLSWGCPCSFSSPEKCRPSSSKKIHIGTLTITVVPTYGDYASDTDKFMRNNNIAFFCWCLICLIRFIFLDTQALTIRIKLYAYMSWPVLFDSQHIFSGRCTFLCYFHFMYWLFLLFLAKLRDSDILSKALKGWLYYRY